jgi:hypothetical protein
MERRCTHEFGECLPPVPLIPRELPYALKFDQEPPLEVQQLVETREQEMESILIYRI